MASENSSNFSTLPILDVSLLNGTTEDEASFALQLRNACHYAGFFYIKGHGVSDDLLKRTFDVTRAFFALPLEQKKAIENIYSKHFRGYTALENETTAGRQDLRETVDFGLETNELPVAPDAPAYLRLHGPNQWVSDDVCPGFKSTITEFMDVVQALSVKLMRAMALSLGLPKSFFDETFADLPHVRMKIIRYPPPSAEAIAKGQLGVGPHKDYGFLTILLQDSIGGLQVLNGAGEWIDAVPIPGTFVINLGEMFELATQGYYVATVHRVQNPSTQLERFSVPYFFNPRLETKLQPLPLATELVNEARQSNHAGKNENNPNNQILPIYGANALKGLARSHPEVLHRHHPDLVSL